MARARGAARREHEANTGGGPKRWGDGERRQRTPPPGGTEERDAPKAERGRGGDEDRVADDRRRAGRVARGTEVHAAKGTPTEALRQDVAAPRDKAEFAEARALTLSLIHI